MEGGGGVLCVCKSQVRFLIVRISFHRLIHLLFSCLVAFFNVFFSLLHRKRFDSISTTQVYFFFKLDYCSFHDRLGITRPIPKLSFTYPPSLPIPIFSVVDNFVYASIIETTTIITPTSCSDLDQTLYPLCG